MLSLEDKKLLDLLQKKFPLVPRPFAVLAEQAGLSEETVLKKVAEWQQAGVVRRLGPVFDSKRLGYQSLLVALACPKSELERVSAIINAYPGVTHNYLREVEDGWPLRYNLWFTMTGASAQEVEENLTEIAKLTGQDDLLRLPAHTLYKIRVQFDLLGNQGQQAVESKFTPPPNPGPATLTQQDWALIEAFQEELAPITEPFQPIAAAAGLESAELLDRVKELQKNGVIRRFGATLKHYAVGFGSNAMGVWAVPKDRENEVGQIMASFSAVSHCYARSTYAQWPFNLYTMLHSDSREGCRKIAAEIAEATGVSDYHLLFTVQELKKERMNYRAPRRHN